MRWIFLLLPWVELFTLIRLGGSVGALSTLAYVFVTLVLGLTILRLQGMEIIGRLRDAQDDGGVVAGRLLADDLAVGLAGLLLLIPGLVTDSAALLVLIGPLWRRLSGASPRPGTDESATGGATKTARDAPVREARAPRGSRTIEGEYRRLDDEDR